MTVPSPLELTKRYLAAVESGATGDALAALYDPSVVQEEFPNRLMPQGARRDLPAILAAAERGQHVVRDQRYQLAHALEGSDRIAFEVLWSATLLVPLGTLAAGSQLRARFAMFIEFRDGKIVSQRNYDCFDAF